MLPADWIEHRRADRECVGWMFAEGDGFHVVDLLGRRITTDPIDWLEAERMLDDLGIGYLADKYLLTTEEGVERSVRIGEVSTSGVVVVADDWGSAYAVGSHPERIQLPFPAPASLRRIS